MHEGLQEKSDNGRVFMVGDIIKARRSSGDIEDDWIISYPLRIKEDDDPSTVVTISKKDPSNKDFYLKKGITLAEVRELNP